MQNSQDAGARQWLRALGNLLSHRAVGVRLEPRAGFYRDEMTPCAVIEIHGKKSLILQLMPDGIDESITALQQRFANISPAEGEAIMELLAQFYEKYPDSAWPLQETKRDPWVITTSGIDSDNRQKTDVVGSMELLKNAWSTVDKCRINVLVRNDGGGQSRKEWLEAIGHEGQVRIAISISHATPLVRSLLSRENGAQRPSWHTHQIDRWAEKMALSTSEFLKGYQQLYGIVVLVQPTLVRLRDAR